MIHDPEATLPRSGGHKTTNIQNHISYQEFLCRSSSTSQPANMMKIPAFEDI
jgi:hypothetical protein